MNSVEKKEYKKIATKLLEEGKKIIDETNPDNVDVNAIRYDCYFHLFKVIEHYEDLELTIANLINELDKKKKIEIEKDKDDFERDNW